MKANPCFVWTGALNLLMSPVDRMSLEATVRTLCAGAIATDRQRKSTHVDAGMQENRIIFHKFVYTAGSNMYVMRG